MDPTCFDTDLRCQMLEIVQSGAGHILGPCPVVGIIARCGMVVSRRLETRAVLNIPGAKFMSVVMWLLLAAGFITLSLAREAEEGTDFKFKDRLTSARHDRADRGCGRRGQRKPGPNRRTWRLCNSCIWLLLYPGHLMLAPSGVCATGVSTLACSRSSKPASRVSGHEEASLAATQRAVAGLAGVGHWSRRWFSRRSGSGPGQPYGRLRSRPLEPGHRRALSPAWSGGADTA